MTPGGSSTSSSRRWGAVAPTWRTPRASPRRGGQRPAVGRGTSSGIDRGSWEIDNHNSVRIGWLDGGRVYLDANEAARLTQAFAAQQNKPLSNPDTVVARLAEKGWLAVERTGGKTRYKTRKTLEGVRRTNLLAFDALVFWPPDGQGRD